MFFLYLVSPGTHYVMYTRHVQCSFIMRLKLLCIGITWCQIECFHCHVIKNKVWIHTMKETKKTKSSKRLIHKQYLQASTLCCSLLPSYLLKRVRWFYRALYGEVSGWCSSKGHQYGGLKSTRTSATQLMMKALSFHSWAKLNEVNHVS